MAESWDMRDYKMTLKVTGCVYLLLGSIAIYYATLRDLALFPDNKGFTIAEYDDRANGGNSRMINSLATDTSHQVSFELGDAFTSPYVGLSVGTNGSEMVDISKYNELRLVAQVENLRGLSVSFYLPYQKIENSTADAQAVFQHNAVLAHGINEITISLEDLYVPDWWFYHNAVPESEKIVPDLRQFRHLNLGSSNNPDFKGPSSITLYSAVFSRDNSSLFFILFLIGLVTPILIVAAKYFTKRLMNRPARVTVSYQSIDGQGIEDHEQFMNFINQNFHQADISLESVSKETGVYYRRISKYIQDKYDCNFKTYLNGLRIAESKRLLKETQLNAGQIAYKVGFSSQSHFNRVFRSLEKRSPTQYRES